MRKTVSAAASLLLIAVLGVAPAGAQKPGAADDGLVAVKARKVDKAWLRPGADFRPYKKVLLKNADVAFQRGWLRDMNSGSASKLSSVTQSDAAKILDAARSGFDAIWAEAFRKTGYEVVTAPGEGVLVISPKVVDLYLNAVDKPTTGISRTYVVQAGEATLHLEARDSRSGEILGRISDRRETMRTPTAEMVTSGSNAAAFGQLFATWAVIAAKGLDELKANSPMPATLKPGQKVPTR